MTTCDDCGTDAAVGYYHTEDGVYCRACRGVRDRVAATEAVDHREQRNRDRTVHNRRGES